MVLFQVSSTYTEEKQEQQEQQPTEKKKSKRKNEPKRVTSKATKKARLAKEERKRMSIQFQNFRQVTKQKNKQFGFTYYSFFVNAFKSKEEHKRITAVIFGVELFKELIHPEDTETKSSSVVLRSCMTFCSYPKIEKFINDIFENKGSEDSFIYNHPDTDKPVYVEVKVGVFTFCYLSEK